MKRISFLFLSITFFQSFIASQEFIDFLKRGSDETIVQFLINCGTPLYITPDAQQEAEKNYERLLTLSPFPFPDLLEAEFPQKEIIPEANISDELEEATLAAMVLSQKRSHKRAVKYAPYSPAKKTITQKKKGIKS